ncbi:MAG: AAA family ATPase [Geobacteraceae bacterium]|nr:AAA family ATPase [Geobacteraceae bacterium]
MSPAFDLTYLKHFGLDEHPFSLTPDTSFYYPTLSGREAGNVLLVALANHEGIVKISGEVGTGKTMLCRKLLNDLPGDIVTAFIPNPALQPQPLFHTIATELGLTPAPQERFAALGQMLQRHLIELRAAGKRALVCVDEAQAMPDKSLEALRLLTNVETEKHKLLQVVLFAQPELDERLQQPHLRQLRQRISFSYTLSPLQDNSTAGYLNFRLKQAGYRGAPLFKPRTLRLLHQASGGIPRLLNILAHKALLAAYGEGMWQIKPSHVRAAIHDTQGVKLPPSRLKLGLITGGVSLILAVCFLLGRYWGGSL